MRSQMKGYHYNFLFWFFRSYFLGFNKKHVFLALKIMKNWFSFQYDRFIETDEVSYVLLIMRDN